MSRFDDRNGGCRMATATPRGFLAAWRELPRSTLCPIACHPRRRRFYKTPWANPRPSNQRRFCWEEQPQGYLRLIAGLLPKEIDLNDNPLKDIPDDELVTLIERFREHIAQSEGTAAIGEGGQPASR